MTKKIGTILAAVGLTVGASIVLPASALATECGTDKKIDIAEMTWESASVLANMHELILTNGYGCNVELVPGDTVSTSASMMTRGEPALAPELWMSSIEKKWDEAEAEGSVTELGAAISGGTLEGLFIPRWVQEEYNIVTIDDVLSHPDLFPDSDNPGKGRIYSGPPGWAAELAVAGVYEAYGMQDNWSLFSVADAALAASIKRAFDRKEPILFYYWSPASVMGQVDAVKLEMPEYKAEVYSCNTNKDCADPAGKTDWPSSRVIVGAASWIADEAPEVAAYLSKASLPAAKISELAAYGEEHGVSSRETAEAFLKDQQDLWTPWVPEDVAEKVLAAL